MRLGLVALCALMVGGCALPARATTYDFDFVYFPDTIPFGDPNMPFLYYDAAEVNFTADSLDATTLYYKSGNVNGYRPATVEKSYQDTFDGRLAVFSQLDYSPLAAQFQVVGMYFYVIDPATPEGANGSGTLFNFGAYRLAANPLYNPEIPYYLGGDGYLVITQETPEPGTWGLVGTGLLGLVGVGRRRLGYA